MVFILSGLFRQWDRYCAYMSMTGHIIQVKEHKNVECRKKNKQVKDVEERKRR